MLKLAACPAGPCMRASDRPVRSARVQWAARPSASLDHDVSTNQMLFFLSFLVFSGTQRDLFACVLGRFNMLAKFGSLKLKVRPIASVFYLHWTGVSCKSSKRHDRIQYNTTVFAAVDLAIRVCTLKCNCSHQTGQILLFSIHSVYSLRCCGWSSFNFLSQP